MVLSLFAGLQVSVANSIRVEGYVYDSKDVGLNGVKVSTKDDYKNYETTTDNYQGDGFYYLKGLGIGTYTFKYEKTGYQTQSMDEGFENDYETIQLKKITMVSNPTSTPSPIPSPPPSSNSLIYGFVNDADDNPLKGVTATLDGIAYSSSVETEKDGYYEFRNLSAGDYTLTCEKDGYQTYTKSIRLGDGEIQEIETITLEKVVTTPTQTQIDITGNWKGYFSTSLIDSDTIYLKLEQFKKSVNGTMSTGEGGRGKVAGKISGKTIKFKIKTTTRKCKGSFKGTATITVNDEHNQVLPKKLQTEGTQFDLRSSTSMYMEFTLTGKDCLGKHKNGEGYVIKQ